MPTWAATCSACTATTTPSSLVLCICIVNDAAHKAAAHVVSKDNMILKCIKGNMLTEMLLHGIANIRKVFLRKQRVIAETPAGTLDQASKEWVLDTEGTSLLGVNHTCTMSTSAASCHGDHGDRDVGQWQEPAHGVWAGGGTAGWRRRLWRRLIRW